MRRLRLSIAGDEKRFLIEQGADMQYSIDQQRELWRELPAAPIERKRKINDGVNEGDDDDDDDDAAVQVVQSDVFRIAV